MHTFDELLKKSKDVEKVQEKPFKSNYNNISSDNANQNRNCADGIRKGDSTTDANNNDLEEYIESNMTDEVLHECK